MNAISHSMMATPLRAALEHPATPKPTDKQLELQETFQDFVAGTFYKQMLRALRRSHDKAAYFHGGRAEDIFQGQLDQQVAENLAREHGAAFADPLFSLFAQQRRSASSGS